MVADLTTLQSTRAYTYVNCDPNTRIEQNMRKPWKEDLEGIDDEDKINMPCCNEQQCFKNCTIVHLREQRTLMIYMYVANSRQHLQNVVFSDCSFYLWSKGVKCILDNVVQV